MKRVNFITITPSAPGTELCLRVVQYGHSKARPKVYIQAGLHANEIPGQLVAACLEDRLDAAQHQLLGHIVLVPMANPIGLGQWVDGVHLGRFEINSGVNFNRRFPDVICPFKTTTIDSFKRLDPEMRISVIREAMIETVKALTPATPMQALQNALFGMAVDSDYVLDLHSDTRALLHLYTGEDSWPYIQPLAERIGARVALIENHAGGRPFDESITRPWRWLREQGLDIPQACKGATLELRGHTDVGFEQATQDASAIMACLHDWGLLAVDTVSDSTQSPSEKPEPYRCNLDAVDVVKSPCYGVVVLSQTLGDWVTEGQEVARVLTYPHHHEAPVWISIITQTSGMVFTQTDTRYVYPGQCIVKVAGDKPLISRVSGQLLED